VPIEKGHKPYNTFVKGIVTEASPLTFPENASIDEQNFVLNRDGSRERRLGIDYENDYVLVDTLHAASSFDTMALSTYKWSNVSGNAQSVITVVQIGTALWFMDATQDSMSANLLANEPLVVGANGTRAYSFAAIGGVLVVVTGEDLPVYITYDGSDFIQSDVNIKIRDFFGVDDSLELSEIPSTLTTAHNYNLFNQGWYSNKITAYEAALPGTYPANNHIWHVAKDASDNFTPTTIAKIDFGTTPAPRGRIVIDAFKRGESRAVQAAVVTAAPVTYTITNTSYPPVVIALGHADVINVKVTVHSENENGLSKIAPLSSKKYSVLSGSPSAVSILQNALIGHGENFIKFVITYNEKVSVLLPLPAEEETGNISAATSYNGRMWYSGISSDITNEDSKSPDYNGYVFFSKLYEREGDLGICYQEADPTAELVSDLIDTDGGYLVIPDAHTIKKLVVTGKHLVVFAENGVWQIFGGEEGFKATSFQVYKVTDVGIDSAASVVEVEGSILYWAKGGIYKISPDPVTNAFVTESLTFNTIDTLYDGISSVAKANATGIYDTASKKVKWLYGTEAAYDGIILRNKYNTELVLDVLLGAFYKNEIVSANTDSPFTAGYVSVADFSNEIADDIVLVGADVVQVGGVDVVVANTAPGISTTSARYLVIKPTTGSNYTFTLGDYTNTDYKDWNTVSGNYFDSYLYTGHDLFETASKDKSSPYIHFYFNRTETGFDSNLDAINSSSCVVQAQWEWSDSINSGRWSTPFQAYRLKRQYIPSGSSDIFDYGHSVITTKSKLRGRGKSLSLYIQSEDGKAMHLLGWGIDIGRATS